MIRITHYQCREATMRRLQDIAEFLLALLAIVLLLAVLGCKRVSRMIRG